MVSNKPFKRIQRFLTKKGYKYTFKKNRIHEYQNDNLIILLFEDSKETHYKYMFIDSSTKWVIKTVFTEQVDRYGNLFRKHLEKIEIKRLY